jgi:hypothetical protein
MSDQRIERYLKMLFFFFKKMLLSIFQNFHFIFIFFLIVKSLYIFVKLRALILKLYKFDGF